MKYVAWIRRNEADESDGTSSLEHHETPRTCPDLRSDRRRRSRWVLQRPDCTGLVPVLHLSTAVTDGAAIVDLVQSQGGVMTLEDLAECQAEVIQPIKYEYKAKEGQDGVSLWEVGIESTWKYLS
jgi:urease gamma subunit